MGKRKILIGSDESYLTESVKVVLANSCEITERRSFAEFVREASTGGFDVVIVCGNCLAPPVICTGGLLENTVATITTMRASCAAPIVVLTSMPEWLKPLRAAGADFCLETPFDAAEFKAALAGCVDRRVGVGELAAGQT